MKSVRYVGPHAAVEIEVNGRWLDVDRDGDIELPAELADSLLEQESNWQPTPAASTKPAKTGKEA